MDSNFPDSAVTYYYENSAQFIASPIRMLAEKLCVFTYVNNPTVHSRLSPESTDNRHTFSLFHMRPLLIARLMDP